MSTSKLVRTLRTLCYWVYSAPESESVPVLSRGTFRSSSLKRFSTLIRFGLNWLQKLKTIHGGRSDRVCFANWPLCRTSDGRCAGVSRCAANFSCTSNSLCRFSRISNSLPVVPVTVVESVALSDWLESDMMNPISTQSHSHRIACWLPQFEERLYRSGLAFSSKVGLSKILIVHPAFQWNAEVWHFPYSKLFNKWQATLPLGGSISFQTWMQILFGK